MKNKWKWWTALGAVLVVGGGLFVWGMQSSKLPDAINMSDMSSMNNMSNMGQMKNMKQVSVTQLVEDPTLKAPVKTFTLTAEDKDLTINGKTVHAITYNGTAPGPELHVQQGDRVIVHLINKSTSGVTIHWHGVSLPNAEDGVAGVTQNAVPPGGQYTYDFIARQAGTYWYHSHQESYKETTGGLFGALVVEPKTNTNPVDHDDVVLLHDWDQSTFTLNDTSSGAHFAAKPGDTVRLRIINSGNSTHKMTLVGAPFRVVAMDASDISSPTPVTEQVLAIGAGQRYDIEFKMPSSGVAKLVNLDGDSASNFIAKLFTPKAASENQMLSATIGNGNLPIDINQLQQQPEFDYTTYGSSAGVDPLITTHSHFNESYDMTLGDSAGFFNGQFTMKFTISGKTFPNVPDLQVMQGDLVKIHIQNNTTMDHPMHLHGHEFVVLTKNGKPLTGSPIALSTILVRPRESYDIAFKADNPGLWMLHCHNLEHAYNGMDMMVTYMGVTTPYTIGNLSGNHPD